MAVARLACAAWASGGLGVVHLRHGRGLQVRVVGVWAPRQPEPWWLATGFADPLVDSVACDDRRMANRGAMPRYERLPLQRTPRMDAVSEFCLTGPLHPIDRGDLALLTAVEQAVVHMSLQVCRPCKRKDPRVSLLRMGIQCVTHLTPRIYRGIRFTRTLLLPPQPHRFLGLPAFEGVS